MTTETPATTEFDFDADNDDVFTVDTSDVEDVCDGMCKIAAERVTERWTAKFHRAAWADAFAARIQEPGYGNVTNVARQKGNVVVWDASRPTTISWGEKWADWAMTVGYYSSPNNPGSVCGQRAIPSY